MKAARGGRSCRATACRPLRPILLAVLLCLPATTALAEEALPAASASANSLEFGFEERVRTENWENAIDFDDREIAAGDVRHQWRFRTRLWERLRIGSRAEFFLQLNNESRRVTTPRTDFAWDETVVENLYADVRSGGQSIRIGRQDIRRGDGLILGDGGPLDGSRTAYMNAIVLTRTFARAKLELMGISNPRRDLYLPPFRDQRKPLVEWNERALVFYLTRTGGRAAGLEAYYVFKTSTDDVRQTGHPAFQMNRAVHTLGGRRAWEASGGFSWNAELAGQAGRQDPDTDLLAWAATVTSRKTIAAAGRPSLSLGVTALSGDDPGTPAVEDWDPLFGRWPRWSELYAYSLAAERGPGYWSSFRSAQVELAMKPLAWLDVRASYSRLGAFPMFSTGTKRGTLATLRADFKVRDGLKGHVVGERLDPDDFYSGEDPAWFFRVELIGSLSGRVGL